VSTEATALLPILTMACGPEGRASVTQELEVGRVSVTPMLEEGLASTENGTLSTVRSSHPSLLRDGRAWERDAESHSKPGMSPTLAFGGAISLKTSMRGSLDAIVKLLFLVLIVASIFRMLTKRRHHGDPAA
jgi:hypothetical protein